MLLEGKSTISMAMFNSKLLVYDSLPMFTKGGKTHHKWWFSFSILMLNYQRVINYVLLPAPPYNKYIKAWMFVLSPA